MECLPGWDGFYQSSFVVSCGGMVPNVTTHYTSSRECGTYRVICVYKLLINAKRDGNKTYDLLSRTDPIYPIESAKTTSL